MRLSRNIDADVMSIRKWNFSHYDEDRSKSLGYLDRILSHQLEMNSSQLLEDNKKYQKRDLTNCNRDDDDD